MFRVGQKVVCVNDVPQKGARWLPGEELHRGNVYTIAAMGFSFGEPAVQLIELPRITDHPNSRHGIWGFLACRFRPLVSRKTDISIFEALLTPSGQKEPANG